MTWLIHTSSQPSLDAAGKNGIARRRTYNRLLRAYVLIDLKIGKHTHQVPHYSVDVL